MRLFRRRPPAPPEAVTGLTSDERVLAWAEATDGSFLVATRRGLHQTLGADTRLLGWHEVTKAVWREGQLTVVESESVGSELTGAELTGAELMGAELMGAELMGAELTGAEEIVDLPPWTVELREPGTLAVVVRQRVEASVVVTRQERVTGGGVRIVGRKVAGVDGLLWQFRPEPGVDTADPQVQAQIAALLEREQTLSRPVDL